MSQQNLNRIKVVLTEKNVTSRALAKHLGKTVSTVSRWCTNDIQPSVNTLNDISVFLKVDIKELLNSTL